MIADVTRRPAAALLLAALVLARTPLSAHDLERTIVTLSFGRDGSFVLNVANDPNWLLLRLEPFAGGSVPAGMTPERRDARLAQLGSVLADRLVLYVDGREIRAGSVEYLPPGSGVRDQGPGTRNQGSGISGPGIRNMGPWTVDHEPGTTTDQRPRPRDQSDPSALAVFRLRGRMPAGAHTLRWFYGIVIDPYPLTIREAGGTSTTEWINGAVWSGVIDLSRQYPRPTRWDIARQYLALGYTHILPKGVDHILFVLGIFLLSPRIRLMLTQVTAFTIAHSITLGLTMYGIVSLSPKIVEPLIALSIAYVAIENLATTRVTPWRLALVFSFGLLHGMGFAGVLKELGLPRESFLAALLSFNLGVEGGQLTVIAAAAAAVFWFRRRASYRRLVVVPASVVIASVGLYWTITRILAARGA